jgi:two-component system, NarL family, response regulator DesR
VIRVMMAENEDLLRDVLTTVLSLEGDIEVVAQADNGVDAVRLATERECDLVMLDIDMPGMGGLEAAEKLRAANCGVPVIILTSLGRPGYLQRALRAGVRGFVTKSMSGGKLAEVIREVHGGGRYIDPEIATDAMFAGDCPLGPRELEILRLAEDGRSLGAIARDLSLSEGTVRNYMSATISKLNTDNKLSAIRHARKMGWL